MFELLRNTQGSIIWIWELFLYYLTSTVYVCIHSLNLFHHVIEKSGWKLQTHSIVNNSVGLDKINDKKHGFLMRICTFPGQKQKTKVKETQNINRRTLTFYFYLWNIWNNCDIYIRVAGQISTKIRI